MYPGYILGGGRFRHIPWFGGYKGAGEGAANMLKIRKKYLKIKVLLILIFFSVFQPFIFLK